MEVLTLKKSDGSNEIIRKPLKADEADPIMASLRSSYKVWRDKSKENSQGFFTVYNSFLQSGMLCNISGNALRLYIYLGINSRNDTGESWHSTQKISDYFDCDKRSVTRWFEELEEKKLIKRVQKGYKRVSNTFLLPY